VSSDRGAVTVVLLAVATATLVVALAVVAVGQFLAGHAAARMAADAAALAAAPVTFRPFGAEGTPAQEAARFARLNGSRLVSCVCPLDESWDVRTAEVTVERSFTVVLFGAQTLQASARAEFAPARLLE